MRPKLILVHGWGCQPKIWDKTVSLLDLPYERVDLGFFGSKSHRIEAEGFNLILVGHSMGFAWGARELSVKWTGAIAVNAFAAFSKRDDFASGLERDSLRGMIARFRRDPIATLGDFLPEPLEAADLSGMDASRLEEALLWLASIDVRRDLAVADYPILAVAGGRDQLISPDMARQSFADKELRFESEGGHFLPLSHPELVARHISEFVAART